MGCVTNHSAAVVDEKRPKVRTDWGNATEAARTLSIGNLEVPANVGVLSLQSRVTPVVQGTAGSGKTALFVLDTGFFFTSVSPELSDHWGLPNRKVAELNIVGGSGSVRVSRCARLKRLQLGDVYISDGEVALQSLPHAIAGVVGVTILAQCPVLFDVKKSEVRFLREGSMNEVLGRLYPGMRWTKLPLHWQDTSPWVELAVEKHNIRMLLDTGSTSSGLQPAMPGKLGLQVVRTEQIRTQDISGEGLHEVSVFRLGKIRLGSWDCCLETASAGNALVDAAQLDGVLGNDLLGQVTWVFDAPGGTIWILDPLPGVHPILLSTQDSRAAAYFEDPLPYSRIFAAVSTAKTGRRRLLSQVAKLLDDEVPEVQKTAVAVVAFFAQESWPDSISLQRAKVWWEKHKGDPENNLPSGRGN
jgi:hypothetical protein